jgi:hypothetical protein
MGYSGYSEKIATQADIKSASRKEFKFHARHHVNYRIPQWRDIRDHTEIARAKSA